MHGYQFNIGKIHGINEYTSKIKEESETIQNTFLNHKIIEVVRITTNQPHGLDFVKQIIVIRENDKPDSFFEADFKYLNKNDIKDLYYLCRNKKVNYRETKLMNSLITFIRSHVIWERVHDFQLGIESYQIKVNLTAPTLTFSGIEAHELYSIVDKPSTSLIYLNSRDEKRVMYLAEIVKFCDATLEKVGESSAAAAARPIGSHRADYGFVGTMDTEIRRQRAEEVGYRIRDVWVDPREAVEEVAPMTLEGVNTRVTKLATVQEQDTHDIYAVIGDTHDRQTQIYQRVKTLVDDSQYHYETARLLDQEALASREAWGRSIEVSYMARSEMMALRSVVMGQQAVISQLQAVDHRSQTVTSEMLQADHRRQAKIGQVTTLQGQVTALQGQQGPSGGPALPVAPEEAGSSS
ncbi:hypothetical protein Tco_0876068 [Tanacetum coccineum]|uniref:Uncharacterized protein n=1 Tax=Tanacetum coccineum TaxID=301880 RepID=A0ABQ5BTZ1_9ASTR